MAPNYELIRVLNRIVECLGGAQKPEWNVTYYSARSTMSKWGRKAERNVSETTNYIHLVVFKGIFEATIIIIIY